MLFRSRPTPYLHGNDASVLPAVLLSPPLLGSCDRRQRRAKRRGSARTDGGSLRRKRKRGGKGISSRGSIGRRRINPYERRPVLAHRRRPARAQDGTVRRCQTRGPRHTSPAEPLGDSSPHLWSRKESRAALHLLGSVPRRCARSLSALDGFFLQEEFEGRGVRGGRSEEHTSELQSQ